MIGTTAAIIGAAAIGAGASMLSADSAAGAAEKGAQVQADAANRAADLQHAQYLQTREDYAPWRQAGAAAVGRQADILGLNGQPAMDNAFAMFREDPGYKYRVGESIKAIDRSAAARGLLTSGATIKAIQDRAGNLADEGFGNWFNRFASVAGTGQTAASGTASAGANAANAGADALMAGGNARASGYRDSANAWNNGMGGAVSSINGGLNNYFAYNGIPGVGANSLANLTTQSIAANPLLF